MYLKSYDSYYDGIASCLSVRAMTLILKVLLHLSQKKKKLWLLSSKYWFMYLSRAMALIITVLLHVYQ